VLQPIIAADGQSAELGIEVVEEVGIGGRSMRMVSQQSGTVVLQAGQPRYSKLSARVNAGQ
jgi:hypothetical protein